MIFLILGSIFSTISSLIISKNNKKIRIVDFFKEPKIVLLNFLPIILCSIILGKLKFVNGAAVVMVVVNTLALIHYYKVQFREEPLYFKDILIFKEAMNMSGQYPLKLNFSALIYILSIFVAIAMQWYKTEFEILTAMLLISIICLGVVWHAIKSDRVYRNLTIKDMNPYIELESYQSKGFLYPFLHSVTDIFEYKFRNYSEKMAVEELSEFEEGKNCDINFLVIMLESFKDFSTVQGNFEFEIDPYEDLKKLKAESLNGGLIVNAFGGGTFITEMQALSGFYHLPKFKRKTKTYVNYFKDLGYMTTAHHPYYGGFYNRKQIYKNIGFESFKYYENYFKNFSKKPLRDREFFGKLMEDFEENSKKSKVFSFAVTFQNHGPYTKDREGEDIIKWKENYDEGLFNYFNNYLRGIKDTSENLKILTDKLNKIDKPTVLVLFGDHSPTMGENKSLIEMLDIEQNLKTIEGVKNLYETPYLFWANESLRQRTKLYGDGRTIEPAFLMAELLNKLKIKGNAYSQFLSRYSEEHSVRKDFINLDGQGNFENLDTEQREKFDNVEYYQQLKN